MADWAVPLADVVVSDEDLAEIVDTYRSGWLSMGPRTQELERAFCELTGARHALAVANGTAALHLACAAAGLGPGDEAIVPSLTFVASANAIAYMGARPVFADIAGLTEPWLDARAVESAIGPATRAIMAVHYGGHPGHVKELAALADRHGLALLEDAAHATGARTGARHLGTFGLVGAFSFFSNKNLAVGEGGLVVTDDDQSAERMRLMRSHGMTTLSWDRHRGHASAYDVVALGFNYRIDEPRAALAKSRLARLEAGNAARHRLDARYRALLADVDGITPTALPPHGPEEVPAHHLFTVVLAEGLDRDEVREELRQRGIQTSVHYPAVHRFSIYAGSAGDLPVTEMYADRALTLPLFPHMTETQQDLVIEALVEPLSVRV
jgi:dTDP-4-amino-4,6-dideoxygalactose transaminase